MSEEYDKSVGEIGLRVSQCITLSEEYDESIKEIR